MLATKSVNRVVNLLIEYLEKENEYMVDDAYEGYSIQNSTISIRIINNKTALVLNVEPNNIQSGINPLEYELTLSDGNFTVTDLRKIQGKWNRVFGI